MPGKGLSDDKNLQFSAIYVGMNPAYRSAVVSRALGARGLVSKETAIALDSAIEKSRLRVTGYRDPLRAPHTVLRDPVSHLVPAHSELGMAVLRVWAESHKELHEKVIEHLKSMDLEPEYPDFSGKQFRRTWRLSDWRDHQTKFLENNADGGFTEDDVALMLCYVAGRVPEKHEGIEADGEVGPNRLRFEQFIDFLNGLPPTAPEWQREVPDLQESLSVLISAKETELKWSDDFNEMVATIRNEFEDILAFFEFDTLSWEASKVSHVADTAETMALAQRLQLLLQEYWPVHDRAPNIREERERVNQRGDLQPKILDIIQEIDRLMTEAPEGSANLLPNTLVEDERGDSPLQKASSRDTRSSAVQEPPPPANSLQEALTALEPSPGESHPQAREHGRTFADVEKLQSENIGLQDSAKTLRAENQDFRDEVEALKTELFSTQEREDSWRLAYRTAVDGSDTVHVEEAPEVDSVNDAVELARSRFRQEMMFAPNSESIIEDNPFSDPLRVWEALRWLGTTYYASKMGRLRVTDFDQSIKEACGWWYKGDQGETTLSRYEKSYTTRVDRRRHMLAEHIGKGTSFDSRYTIRIAFCWDKDRRQVIVGYIGRHQQTDAS